MTFRFDSFGSLQCNRRDTDQSPAVSAAITYVVNGPGQRAESAHPVSVAMTTATRCNSTSGGGVGLIRHGPSKLLHYRPAHQLEPLEAGQTNDSGNYGNGAGYHQMTIAESVRQSSTCDYASSTTTAVRVYYTCTIRTMRQTLSRRCACVFRPANRRMGV